MKRKWIILVLVLLCAVLLPVMMASAETETGQCGDNLTYTLTDDGVLTISGTGDMWNDMDMSWPTEFTRVVIKNGVTSIGEDAFAWYSDMTSVTIPDSVTSIGGYAFWNCSGLTSITIPDSVTSIDDSAFLCCSGLTSVTIPGSVTYMGESVFDQCTGLTSVTISDGVTSIGELAFISCFSLTSITIPDSVTSIGDKAFDNCTSLTSVSIPDSVTYIGDYAFDGCTSLTNITIPDSVTYIGRGIFAYCASLTSVTIPDGVTSIGEDAFYECTGLTSVTIPDGVTSIGEWAFKWCTSLTSVSIPDSVTTIGDTTFYEIDNLRLSVGCSAYAKEWAISNGFTEVQGGGTVSGKQFTVYHNWNAPTYAWNDDHTTVTATRTCTHDATHTETETATATAQVTKPSACTENGQTTYTSAVFANKAFEKQVLTLDDIPALGHEWNAPIYAWNDDHTTVTATRICKRDATHIETETVSATAKVTMPATCTENGQTTYTSADFTNNAFAPQVITLYDITALGHNWNAPSYTWNDDHTTVTATRTCTHDATHTETETATATAQVTKPATCTEDGQTTYTSAAFANKAFEKQVLTLDNIPALGHQWERVNSVAASSSANGVRGGIQCTVCKQMKEANRAVSAQKVLLVPAMMNTIEAEAFYGIAAEQVTIPGNTAAIGSKAFADCGKLLLVVIPASVTGIADDAFAGCDVAVICPNDSYAAEWCDAHSILHNP